jgi:hypothetical protein
VVEATSLREEHERFFRRALEAVPEVEPEGEPRCAVLDYRLDREGKLPDGAHRQTAAARLVAGEPSAVDEQDGSTLAAEAIGGRRAGRPGSDDQGVEPLH